MQIERFCQYDNFIGNIAVLKNVLLVGVKAGYFSRTSLSPC